MAHPGASGQRVALTSAQSGGPHEPIVGAVTAHAVPWLGLAGEATPRVASIRPLALAGERKFRPRRTFVTEIPEHLLKRAQERRAALSGQAPAEDAPAAAPAAAAGEAVAPAAAAPPKQRAPLPTLDVEPAPVVPDSPVVAAARNRKRVPFWAAPVLALLPLWAFIYVYAVQPPPAGENDPLVIGKAVYASAGCLGCHGAQGQGGAGQKLSEGHADETFKDPLALVHWLVYGAAGGARPDGTYGDLDRPGGAMNVATLPGQMPAFGTSLSAEELAAVTLYVRSEFGGTVYDPQAEQGFTVADFEADAAKLEAEVTAVVALPAGGDPDLSGITRGP